MYSNRNKLVDVSSWRHAVREFHASSFLLCKMNFFFRPQIKKYSWNNINEHQQMTEKCKCKCAPLSSAMSAGHHLLFRSHSPRLSFVMVGASSCSYFVAVQDGDDQQQQQKTTAASQRAQYEKRTIHGRIAWLLLACAHTRCARCKLTCGGFWLWGFCYSFNWFLSNQSGDGSKFQFIAFVKSCTAVEAAVPFLVEGFKCQLTIWISVELIECCTGLFQAASIAERCNEFHAGFLKDSNPDD